MIAADLSISATASPVPVVTGSPLTYTLTVTNHGPSAASSVEVAAELPDTAALVSCSANAGGVCSGSGDPITVSFASLPAGGSATVTLVVEVGCAVADGALLHLAAALRSATADPDPGDNAANLATGAANPPPAIAGAAVSPSVLWPPNHRMVEVAVRFR